MKKIAIIGEFREHFKPHSTMMASIEHVKKKCKFDIEYEWVDTSIVERYDKNLLRQYAGFWSAPGSPFNSLSGAVKAIEYARINNIPHLGTCAGFQHTIIEFARNVLHIADAQHEEYESESSSLFISKLSRSLVGEKMQVRLLENSIAYDSYNKDFTTEDYYCNFGINPHFAQKLTHPDLKISGIDQFDEIRIIEIPKNRFFISTLFVPQTNSSSIKPHPLIEQFVTECSK